MELACYCLFIDAYQDIGLQSTYCFLVRVQHHAVYESNAAFLTLELRVVDMADIKYSSDENEGFNVEIKLVNS